MSNLLEMVRERQLRSDLPQMHPGDTVRVHARIVEGNKERIQVFEGTIIRVRKNKIDASITVRRVAHSIGVERTFMLNSPRVDRFEVVRRGRVRRAALYYLRERTGKATRIKEKRTPQAPRGSARVAAPEPVAESVAAPIAATSATQETTSGV
ncbi:MAG: hypothetical protein NVSMB65_07310 [Chloroflexota bacterium]